MSGETIWKYPLRITDHQVIDMPEDADVLCVQVQNNQLCLWAIVLSDVTAAKRGREFEVVGTGNPMPSTTSDRHYIGTAQMGPFVWHVFELQG